MPNGTIDCLFDPKALRELEDGETQWSQPDVKVLATEAFDFA